MRRSFLRAMLTALALAVMPVASAWGQDHGTPTRAGTSIENKAKALYSDTNNNVYSDSASISFTVARINGVEIAGPAANPTPESPSTENVIEYILKNTGNHVDRFQLNVTPGAGITVTGYSTNPNGPWEPNLLDFNTALGLIDVDYEGNNGGALGKVIGDPNDPTLKVYLQYSLDADFDPDEKLVVEVLSKEEPGKKDDEETTFDPVYKREITVTAQGGPQTHLPSGNPAGPAPLVEYTAIFNVENKGSGKDFDWEVAVTSPDASKFTIVSVDGGADLTGGAGGGTSGTLELATGATMQVTVTYTIASDAAAGRLEEIKLTVTSQADANVKDDATINVTVVRPTLSITKAAFADDDETALAAGGVAPGATVWYKITVTNTMANGADAANVVITDELPDALEYISSKLADGTTNWKIVGPGDPGGAPNTVKFEPVTAANDPRAMTTGETAIFWIEVKVR